MCTAYRLGKKEPSLKQKEWDLRELLGMMEEDRVVRLTIDAPVVMPDGTARLMKWGFRVKVPAKKTASRWQTVGNSREDKLGTRTWNKAFKERRCLVPVAGFYEWVARGGKNVPLLFERPGGEIIWIAGIWEHDKERDLDCFSMITTVPATSIAPVHDRMPAVLTEDQIAPYLAGELHVFGASAVELVFAEAANFIKEANEKAAAAETAQVEETAPVEPEKPVQGELEFKMPNAE